MPPPTSSKVSALEARRTTALARRGPAQDLDPTSVLCATSGPCIRVHPSRLDQLFAASDRFDEHYHAHLETYDAAEPATRESPIASARARIPSVTPSSLPVDDIALVLFPVLGLVICVSVALLHGRGKQPRRRSRNPPPPTAQPAPQPPPPTLQRRGQGGSGGRAKRASAPAPARAAAACTQPARPAEPRATTKELVAQSRSPPQSPAARPSRRQPGAEAEAADAARLRRSTSPRSTQDSTPGVSSPPSGSAVSSAPRERAADVEPRDESWGGAFRADSFEPPPEPEAARCWRRGASGERLDEGSAAAERRGPLRDRASSAPAALRGESIDVDPTPRSGSQPPGDRCAGRSGSAPCSPTTHPAAVQEAAPSSSPTDRAPGDSVNSGKRRRKAIPAEWYALEEPLHKPEPEPAWHCATGRRQRAAKKRGKAAAEPAPAAAEKAVRQDPTAVRGKSGPAAPELRAQPAPPEQPADRKPSPPSQPSVEGCSAEGPTSGDAPRRAGVAPPMEGPLEWAFDTLLGAALQPTARPWRRTSTADGPSSRLQPRHSSETAEEAPRELAPAHILCADAPPWRRVAPVAAVGVPPMPPNSEVHQWPVYPQPPPQHMQPQWGGGCCAPPHGDLGWPVAMPCPPLPPNPAHYPEPQHSQPQHPQPQPPALYAPIGGSQWSAPPYCAPPQHPDCDPWVHCSHGH
eukprot:TRINITY_DN9883_c0_g1_i2.p1 TRINITY_DN9883_c0_g1~~TRINITY_DN9883_c0_g1_i2.p1  ORF type:complete len:716 (+),score=80.59 TRINITY_DN9883_c0_g1_i2:77-2149(+)